MKILLPLAALLLAAPLIAADEPVTPGSVVKAAPETDWQAIDPADLLVMQLAPDAAGKPRKVVIQLMPPPFSQGWVENIRTLAHDHWWDGTSVYRVVDNWVTQWGDVDGDDPDHPEKAKPLPKGLNVVPESAYSVALMPGSALMEAFKGEFDAYGETLRSLRKGKLKELPRGDPYSGAQIFYRGWPIVANDYQADAWPIHCYGMVGVARDLSPNTGTGAELYTVIGQAPRQLDRNIALVGRVIEGMEFLSSLPRGHGEAGVYEGDEVSLRVPILSVRLGNELPAGEQPKFEYLKTDSASFARYAQVSANRNDSFYRVPAGGIDICNLKVPVRHMKE